ncbi:hypothetical protein D6D01_06677 [Aureobasidium pullulans]|uniref:Uncharacterized protein n=1 Tax=Aureobasidium pullulans TaxID=5580 RepID=A0A4S9KWX8_AURPU|nr:hypothetical protein D6D01_06677 [Aureobasidium pullulans]
MDIPYSRKLAADFEDVMWTALTRKDPPIYANVDDYGVSKPAVVNETPPLPLSLELKNAKRFRPSSQSITTDLYADHLIRILVELTFRLRVLSPWNSDRLNSGKDTNMCLGLDQHTAELWGKFGMGDKEGVLIVEDTDSLYDWAVDSPAMLKLEWRSKDVRTGEKRVGPQCMGSVEISANQGVKGVMFEVFDGWDAQFYTESVIKGHTQDWQAWATEWDAIAREEEVFIESY